MQGLKRIKKYSLFVLIIILLGLALGIFYYNIQSQEIKQTIMNTLMSYQDFHYNAIIKDLIIMSLLVVMSFLIIGVPFLIFYLFYEGITIGLLFSAFWATYQLKGFFFILLYFLITKLIPLIIMAFFIKFALNISRYIIGIILYKDMVLKDKIINNFTKSLMCLIITLIFNIIMYFISSPIFTNLSFLR